jgi:threonylcarbamoyladenosine tRNA methylthiotransferase MtaB
MDVRRERTHILRALSDRKNEEFRRGMIGKTLPAVTLAERGMALSSNFLKIRMTTPREPNRMVELAIGSTGDSLLQERELLPILP